MIDLGILAALAIAGAAPSSHACWSQRLGCRRAQSAGSQAIPVVDHRGKGQGSRGDRVGIRVGCSYCCPLPSSLRAWLIPAPRPPSCDQRLGVVTVRACAAENGTLLLRTLRKRCSGTADRLHECLTAATSCPSITRENGSVAPRRTVRMTSLAQRTSRWRLTTPPWTSSRGTGRLGIPLTRASVPRILARNARESEAEEGSRGQPRRANYSVLRPRVLGVTQEVRSWK